MRRTGGVSARTALVIVAAVATTLVLSGCASLPGAPGSPTARPAARVQAAVDCGASLREALGEGSPAPAPAEPGAIPAGFEPVAAVMCSTTSVTDSAGEWSAIKQTRYTGDLSALIAALNEPDDLPPAGEACPAMAELPPALWLVDANGSAVWVAYPKDGCGFSKKDPDTALAALTATELGVTKVQLVTPAAALDSK